jgi:hypothetical protein
MKTALLVIATGERYHQYINPLLLSARTYFVPHMPIVWSDRRYDIPELPRFYKENEGFPLTTLHRYHTFLEQRRTLECYDYLYYVDVDMEFVAPVTEDEIFADGIVATEHPGYLGLNGTPEKNPESSAYCPIVRNYVCGGFNGGTTEAFLKMAENIVAGIDQDTKKGIKAVWNDESFLNRYIFENPPAKLLTPSYCFPESEYRQPGGYYSAIWAAAGRTGIVPKLLALDKVK